ncbi:hypothetical protein DFH29DRAFT_814863, partial [Suillus ampliporus]
QVKDVYQPRFIADATLYNTLLTQVTSFTSLRQLVCRGMLLPNNFHSIVHSFPLLRDLAIVHCTLPFVRPLDFDHTSLKIESLTLLDIRYAVPPRPDDNDIPRTALRRLATAPTLRTLTCDYTVWVHRVFTISTPCPPLTALDVKFPFQKDRDRARVPHGFIPFLETLPSLRTLILRNHVPALPLLPNALPALRSLSAPFSAIPSICSGRRINQLDIRDEAVLAPLYKAFEVVHSHLSLVQELSLFLGDWDDEVILAIVAHFPSLTKLQVRYARGGPSEDTILGMGSRTLHTLTHLVSAHIFHIDLSPRPQNLLQVEANNQDDDTAYGAPGIDDTYFQSMHDIEPATEAQIAWNRACPALRNVQLHAGWVWRRADPVDSWVARPCEWGIWGDVFGSTIDA